MFEQSFVANPKRERTPDETVERPLPSCVDVAFVWQYSWWAELAGGYPSVVAAFARPEDVVDFFDCGHQVVGYVEADVSLCV